MARPPHERGAGGATTRRLRVPARRGPAGREGDAPVRSGRLDDRPVHRPPPAALRAPVEGDPTPRAPARVEPAAHPASPTVVVYWFLAHDVDAGRISLGAAVVYAQAGVRHQLAGVGRLQLGAVDIGAARRRRVAARRPTMADGRRPRARDVTPRRRATRPRDPLPRRSFRLSRRAREPVLDGFDLTIPAGTSLAIVGQNGAGKTTLAKLLCRLYDPQDGAIEVDGVDLRDLDLDDWRATRRRRVPGLRALRAAACATTSRRAVRRTKRSSARSRDAGADRPRRRSTPSSRKAYEGGTDLSGGQWQRVALGPGAVRRRARRGRRAARRADRAARRARRGRDLRAHPRRDPTAAPRSSSRTASRPCARPTASACSNTVGSSSSAPTTS